VWRCGLSRCCDGGVEGVFSWWFGFCFVIVYSFWCDCRLGLGAPAAIWGVCLCVCGLCCDFLVFVTLRAGAAVSEFFLGSARLVCSCWLGLSGGLAFALR